MQATHTASTPAATPDHSHQAHQKHPIGLYLKIWALLFVLSAFSYMVDYFQLQGLLRWSLIITFMMLKAGLIVAIFMHMAWERMALICAILLPPLALLVLVGLMASEGGYTHLLRVLFYR
jgi:cytochrome c oxidase subunit 4